MSIYSAREVACVNGAWLVVWQLHEKDVRRISVAPFPLTDTLTSTNPGCSPPLSHTYLVMSMDTLARVHSW